MATPQVRETKWGGSEIREIKHDQANKQRGEVDQGVGGRYRRRLSQRKNGDRKASVSGSGKQASSV